MKLKKCVSLLIIITIISSFSLTASETIPSPEEVLGFPVGQDFKLASWSQILSYFDMLSSASPKVKVFDLGKSTLGRRFIMVAISSPSNISRLEEIRDIQKKLHDPRLISAGEKEELLKKGKAIVLVSCSIHSTEIAASQMSLELSYKLATEDNPEILNILDETVLLLIPSSNPDGIDIVYDWYTRYVGTPYEASPMPWLYHHYVGHDNNRDWFMITQKETQLITKVLYHDWFPLLVYDVHQMGSYGARFFIPPYYDPINPNIDPLLLRQLYLLTSEAALALTKKGMTGVATNAIFDAWYSAACRAAPLRHNVLGILSEAASARVASPLFIRKNEIQMRRRGFQGSGIQANYLDPWPGGWWKIRNIIEYEEITALSFLKTIAKNKEKYLSMFSLLAQRQIEKGNTQLPFAYLVPLKQRDLPTVYELLKILQKGGSEIFVAQKAFVADEASYPAGTFIIPLAQPYRAFIKDMLERKTYPTRITGEGIPELPYDEASWTLPLQMDVKVIEVTNTFSVEKKLIKNIENPPSEIQGKGSKYFFFSNQSNNGSILINRLIEKNITINYSKKSFNLEGRLLPPGTIVIPGKEISLSELSHLSKDLGIVIFRTDKKLPSSMIALRAPKIGLYQPWASNTDEGWLRWTLEQFEFPFKLLHNNEMKAGNLNRTYSHIILPSMSTTNLIQGRQEGEVPPQYAGGIGNEGISALDNFVQSGGTLIVIGNSADFALKYLGLPVKNLVDIMSLRRRFYSTLPKDKQKESIYCPGSILKVEIDNSHPVAFGLQKQGAVFSYFSPVFEVEKGTSIASYHQYNPLLSGVLINENKIFGKAAAVECPRGQGKVLLLGFKVIHRAQAHGTFKFIFNALLY